MDGTFRCNKGFIKDPEYISKVSGEFLEASMTEYNDNKGLVRVII